MARDNTRGPRLDQPMERGLSLRPLDADATALWDTAWSTFTTGG